MRPRAVAGGVLWDAFLILVVCVGAFFAWRTRDRWGGALKKIPGLSGVSDRGNSGKRGNVHLDRRSALAQTRVREFLAHSGVDEKNIIKSFNEERHGGGVTWLESTMEMSRPKSFQSGPFLKNVLVFLSQNDLALMRDELEQGTWTLEFGDRDHVFQRLVIRDR